MIKHPKKKCRAIAIVKKYGVYLREYFTNQKKCFMRTIGKSFKKETLQDKYLQLSEETLAVINAIKDAIKKKTGENLSMSEVVNSVFTEFFEDMACPAKAIAEMLVDINLKPDPEQ